MIKLELETTDVEVIGLAMRALRQKIETTDRKIAQQLEAVAAAEAPPPDEPAPVGD